MSDTEKQDELLLAIQNLLYGDEDINTRIDALELIFRDISGLTEPPPGNMLKFDMEIAERQGWNQGYDTANARHLY